MAGGSGKHKLTNSMLGSVERRSLLTAPAEHMESRAIAAQQLKGSVNGATRRRKMEAAKSI